MRWPIRKLSSAICTSGEPGVALGRGVLGDDLLLGLRVGSDRHTGSSPVSLRGAPGPVHPGTRFRGRCHGGRPPVRDNRRRLPTSHHTAKSTALGRVSSRAQTRGSRQIEQRRADQRGRPARPCERAGPARHVGRLRGRPGRPPVRGLGAVDHGEHHLDDRPRRPGRRDVGRHRRRRRGRHGRPRDAPPRQPARRDDRALRPPRPPPPGHRGRAARDRRRPQPRGRADRDDLAVLTGRPPRRRRGVPEAHGFELGIAQRCRRSATSRRPSTPGPSSRPRSRHSTPTTSSSPGRTRSPNPSSRGTAASARRSTTRPRSATSTSAPRSGPPTGSPNATPGSSPPAAASSASSRTPPTGRAWPPPSSSSTTSPPGAPSRAAPSCCRAITPATARPGPQAGQPASAVRQRFPDCRYAFTVVAGVNAPMNAWSSKTLGFRDVERALEMQRRL